MDRDPIGGPDVSAETEWTGHQAMIANLRTPD
jgi:hypothetical protein